MKQELPKSGYMVLVANNANSMNNGLYIMARFEKGRAVLGRGTQLVAPTIFLNRKTAEAAIKREKTCLQLESSRWREDVEYMRKRGLFWRYHGLKKVMNAQSHGCLCGTRRPMFKIQTVNIAKWKELFKEYDFIPRGNRLVERRKEDKAKEKEEKK